MQVEAPKDKKSTKARINWILRQLKTSDPTNVIIRILWASRASDTDVPLSKFLESIDIPEIRSSNAPPRAFEIMTITTNGGRFSGSKTFIQDLEELCPNYYENIGQFLKNPPKPSPPTLIESVKGHALYIPVLLAVTTGMRRGEILALRWGDVDLERATLSVTQTLEKTRQGGLQFKQPKTKRSRRSISLPSMLVDALRKHRADQAELHLSLGVGWKEHGLVCSKLAGEPIIPGTLTNMFGRFVKSIDIPPIRFHDLRHTHATHLLRQGVHPKVAQERLGHATIAVTLDLYSHVMPGMQENAALKVDTALRAALGKRNKADN